MTTPHPIPAPNHPVMLYVTAPSRDAALALGRALVAERLAACVNVLDGMTSVYRWNGVVEEAAEAVLLVKTLAGRYEAAAARIAELHPYETPCVLEIPLGRGAADYVAWLTAGVAGGVAGGVAAAG